eukprot:752273-Amphidinium_carterae.1
MMCNFGLTKSKTNEESCKSLWNLAFLYMLLTSMTFCVLWSSVPIVCDVEQFHNPTTITEQEDLMKSKTSERELDRAYMTIVTFQLPCGTVISAGIAQRLNK